MEGDSERKKHSGLEKKKIVRAPERASPEKPGIDQLVKRHKAADDAKFADTRRRIASISDTRVSARADRDSREKLKGK